jgi:hypothetical protein
MSTPAHTLFRTLCFLGTSGILSSASAATVTYVGPSMGTWSTPGFWSNGVVPGAGDSVHIINNGTVDGFVNGNVSIAQPGLSSLDIDGRNGAWAILATSKNLIVQGNANLGVTGLGAVEQKGGNSQYGHLRLGTSGSTSYGYYTLFKGNVSAGNITVGSNGFGVFNHLKGNVTVNSTFTVGDGTTLDSLYAMRNGKLNVGSATYIGGNGNGFYEQSKGTASFGNLNVGHGTGVNGSVKQFGGNSRSNTATLGNQGLGYFEQYNGTHTVTGNLTLGSSTGGAGVYTLGNGTLNVGGQILVGGQGEGVFFQLGGKVTASQGVSVGQGEYQLKNTALTTKGLSVAGGSYFTTEGTKSSIRTSGNIEFASSANITTRDATLSVVKGSSISLSAVQSDTGASFSALSGAASWNAITLEKNVSLTLSGTGGAHAIYVDSFNIGSKKPFLVESIVTGNGVNIYYNADLKSNKYLKGGTYDFINGGQLIPVFASGTSAGLVKTGAGSLILHGGGTFGAEVTIGNLQPGNSMSASLTLELNTLGTIDAIDLTAGDLFTFEGGLTFQLIDFGQWTTGADGSYILGDSTWVLVPTPEGVSGTLSESSFSSSGPSTVPEPTSALLALLGAASLLARRTRR